MTATSTKMKPSKKGPTVGKKTYRENTDTYSGRLGAAIRARRQELGLSVPQLVAKLKRHKCNTAPTSLYSYEQGAVQIQVNDLPAFAKALDTTIQDLLPRS